MPTKPASPCSHPGCRVLGCAMHTRRPWQRHEGRSAASRGYGAEHRRLRAQVLAEEPFCRGCGAPSTDTDHIVPLARGGQTTRANMQGLCAACHRRKTAAHA